MMINTLIEVICHDSSVMFSIYLNHVQFLDFNNLWYFNELAMLIERTKRNISEVFIYIFNKADENTVLLIKEIANKCPKLNC